MHYVLKGAVLGFLIAAPVGPIGLLCINRTLRSGRLAGFASGIGAATADTIYACIAAFGLKTVIGAFTAAALPFHIAGAVFLCYLGLSNLRSRGESREYAVKRASIAGMYGSTVLLTLLNPATIFSFLALFSVSLKSGTLIVNGATLLTVGAFIGSAAWWLMLSTGVGAARKMMSATIVSAINKLSAISLIGFALFVLIT